MLLVAVLLPLSHMVMAESDPLEGLNRSMYSFNSTVDKYAFKPLAKGYKAVTPDLVETGVSNFFANLGDVGNLVNNVLQFKLKDAVVDLGRLSFNSTFGLAGLIDVATPMGLERNNEDFGQTLGTWGVPSGPYLVMPFFGPSTLRDAPASFVPLDPVYYVDDAKTRNALYAGQLIDARAKLLKYESLVSGDEYIFVRDAYLGRREQLVNDGVAEEIFDSSDF
ncbi:MAG: MlaA family lipoprotein [Pseudomonadales bacterium]